MTIKLRFTAFLWIKSFALLFLGSLLLSCEKQNNSLDQPQPQYFESYRFTLWQKLFQNQWRFDFVGTKQDRSLYGGWAGQLFDRDHEGIAGAQSTDVTKRIYLTVFEAGIPDVVLLCIGGNDVATGVPIDITIRNMKKIVSRILAFNPEAVIFIEKIAPAKMQGATNELNKDVEVLNHRIVQLVADHPELASNLVLVDMYTDWQDDYFADDIHYNETGATVVAKRYFDSMSKRLDNSRFYRILLLGDSRVSGRRPEQ